MVRHLEIDIEQNMEEENIYATEIREKLLEEDALQNKEDAFMRGYEEGLKFKAGEDEDDDDVDWRLEDSGEGVT